VALTQRLGAATGRGSCWLQLAEVEVKARAEQDQRPKRRGDKCRGDLGDSCQVSVVIVLGSDEHQARCMRPRPGCALAHLRRTSQRSSRTQSTGRSCQSRTSDRMSAIERRLCPRFSLAEKTVPAQAASHIRSGSLADGWRFSERPVFALRSPRRKVDVVAAVRVDVLVVGVGCQRRRRGLCY
jgi:hypothetical protein